MTDSTIISHTPVKISSRKIKRKLATLNREDLTCQNDSTPCSCRNNGGCTSCAKRRSLYAAVPDPNYANCGYRPFLPRTAAKYLGDDPDTYGDDCMPYSMFAPGFKDKSVACNKPCAKNGVMPFDMNKNYNEPCRPCGSQLIRPGVYKKLDRREGMCTGPNRCSGGVQDYPIDMILGNQFSKAYGSQSQSDMIEGCCGNDDIMPMVNMATDDKLLTGTDKLLKEDEMSSAYYEPMCGHNTDYDPRTDEESKRSAAGIDSNGQSFYNGPDKYDKGCGTYGMQYWYPPITSGGCSSGNCQSSRISNSELNTQLARESKYREGMYSQLGYNKGTKLQQSTAPRESGKITNPPPYIGPSNNPGKISMYDAPKKSFLGSLLGKNPCGGPYPYASNARGNRLENTLDKPDACCGKTENMSCAACESPYRKPSKCGPGSDCPSCGVGCPQFMGREFTGSWGGFYPKNEQGYPNQLGPSMSGTCGVNNIFKGVAKSNLPKQPLFNENKWLKQVPVVPCKPGYKDRNFFT